MPSKSNIGIIQRCTLEFSRYFSPLTLFGGKPCYLLFKEKIRFHLHHELNDQSQSSQTEVFAELFFEHIEVNYVGFGRQLPTEYT